MHRQVLSVWAIYLWTKAGVGWPTGRAVTVPTGVSVCGPLGEISAVSISVDGSCLYIHAAGWVIGRQHLGGCPGRRTSDCGKQNHLSCQLVCKKTQWVAFKVNQTARLQRTKELLEMMDGLLATTTVGQGHHPLLIHVYLSMPVKNIPWWPPGKELAGHLNPPVSTCLSSQLFSYSIKSNSIFHISRTREKSQSWRDTVLLTCSLQRPNTFVETCWTKRTNGDKWGCRTSRSRWIEMTSSYGRQSIILCAYYQSLIHRGTIRSPACGKKNQHYLTLVTYLPDGVSFSYSLGFDQKFTSVGDVTRWINWWMNTKRRINK